METTHHVGAVIVAPQLPLFLHELCEIAALVRNAPPFSRTNSGAATMNQRRRETSSNTNLHGITMAQRATRLEHLETQHHLDLQP
ncbi:hypothetical protein DEO72_LG2g2722 [Vigna unguiculata]|uniref:Uncharacterized protein n=1 Tax=Vigna unguiculata TaxID=3917 RepID=A0A4D6L1P4_VIGUN|nr:hypothetical protein DEO72_LG2g2722 [Vigna unguiculata]